MFKSSEEFQEAAKAIQELAERNLKGEVSDEKLYLEYKKFRREASDYFQNLKKQINSNPDWS